MVRLEGRAGLLSAVGSELGASDWFPIDQRRIDLFAETTGDRAWIHVDPARAADGPFGRTIAHGLLTLSLVTMLAGQVFRIQGLRSALHYGYDRVRFIRPVGVTSSVRARVTLADVEGTPARTRARYHVVVDTTDGADPACVADLIYFYEFADGRPADGVSPTPPAELE
jgi:acyl dehydratase